MKRLIAIAGLALLAIGAPAFAWNISSYDTRIEIQSDASMIVTETITADFTNDPHHGIWRKIPLVPKDRFGNNHRLRDEVLAVTDASGASLPVKITYEGGFINYKIGDPNVLVDGPRTYIIRYKIMRAVRFFDDWDELYWNPVGTEWQAGIDRATCEVILPKDVPPAGLRTASYTGFYGSTTSDAASEIVDKRTIRFRATRPLNAGEGLTVVVGWPKGVVTPPSIWQNLLWFATDNGYVFLPVIFLVGLCVVWGRVGRDPDTGKSEMVAYDPPDGMSPAEIGTLIDEKADMRDITATIVDLAVRGYITIEAEQAGGIFRHTDYTLHRTPKGASQEEMSPYERQLVKSLFKGMDFCTIDSLKNSFYAHLPALRDDLYDSVIKRKYFTHRPDQVRSGYLAAGGAILALAFFGGIFGANLLPTALGWSVAVGLCGIMLMIASRTMPRKTSAGKNALLAVKGFEEYLSRAEKAEIEYQERQNYFEKFLPYAIALGIADKWANAFEGLQTQPPSWYSGYDGAFRPVIFTRDLNGAMSGWSSAMTSTPRSSGSGGSGSSWGGSGFSGGFSGGGGGGGGGGGW